MSDIKDAGDFFRRKFGRNRPRFLTSKYLFSMNKCDKLLQKAKSSANNFSFTEICQLAECYGFQFQRQSGSHVIYEHPGLGIEQNRLLNFQNFKGQAKPYQVRQLLKAISFLSE